MVVRIRRILRTGVLGNVNSRLYPRGMKRIGDLMTRDVLAVAPEDTLGEAAQKMVDRKVGSAVVMDFGRLIGILTERDLMRATAGRAHSSEAPVPGGMTAHPGPGAGGTSAAEAPQTMPEHRLPPPPGLAARPAAGGVGVP